MQGYTFSEISRKWLENAVIGVSFSWDEELKSIVGHLNKALGKKKIDDIKASDIEFLIKTLSVKNPNTNGIIMDKNERFVLVQDLLNETNQKIKSSNTNYVGSL